jgi:DnaJ-domain-containing protein 1
MPKSLDKLIETVLDAIADSGILEDIADMLNPAAPLPQKRTQTGRKAVSGSKQAFKTAKTPKARVTAERANIRRQYLYDALEVSPTASTDVIKAAYRSLSRVYHPDVPYTGNATKMRLLNSAYEVLSDPKKRKEYDARR